MQDIDEKNKEHAYGKTGEDAESPAETESEA